MGITPILHHSNTPPLQHSVDPSEPHVSQHEIPELFDIRPLEIAMDCSLTPDDIDLDLFRLGDFAEVVNSSRVDAVFDQSAGAGFFALVQAADPREFQGRSVHGHQERLARIDVKKPSLW